MRNRGNAAAPANDVLNLPQRFPSLPAEVLERFPAVEVYEKSVERFWRGVTTELTESRSYVSDVINQNQESVGKLTVTVGELTATVDEFEEVTATELEAIARRIVTVSAIAGVSSNITVSSIAPVGPSVNDYWVDTSMPQTPITKKWDGASWVEVTTQVSFAAVSQEQAARVTADGYLSGKYTLTVVAGDVVSGMNITSASGPGVNISEVTFQADRFQIYSGTTKKVMFVSDAISDTVKLADTLVVDRAAGSLYIGAGNFNDSSTPWYVDSLSRMSLGEKLVWDGTNLSIDGTLAINDGIDNEVLVDADGFSVGDRTSNRYIWMQSWAAGSSSSIGIEMVQTNYTMAYGSNNPYVYGMYSEHSGGTSIAVGLNPQPLIQMLGSSSTILLDGSSGEINTDGRVVAAGYNVGGSAGITISVVTGLGNTLNFEEGILTSVS